MAHHTDKITQRPAWREQLINVDSWSFPCAFREPFDVTPTSSASMSTVADAARDALSRAGYGKVTVVTADGTQGC